MRHVGCFVRKNCVTEVFLSKYEFSLLQAAAAKNHVDAWKVIGIFYSAFTYLHCFRYAHNNIHFGNFTIAADGSSVLIDLEFCAPLGTSTTRLSRHSSKERYLSVLKLVGKAVRGHENRTGK